ncbi:hypothetical protein ACFYW6_35455 [Streptomyces sp. NPDC002659]|uniref:hypothetical protein n=1 Tax=Streptomyces sp. NPDC002659 TaxID=3364656 RepID=UPI00367489AD
MQRIAAWHREFQIWYYTVSYSQLLLRSLVDDVEGRVDVLFTHIRFLHIPYELDRLVIDEVAADEVSDLAVPEVSDDERIFLLNEGEGYVIARLCDWHEDRGDHHSPSRFGPLRGLE